MTFATCTCPDCGTPYPNHLTTCPQVATKPPHDTPGIDQAKLDELNRQIERLKSENARLAAELEQERDKVRQCMEHMHCFRCGMPDITRHGTPHFQVAAYDLHDGRGELTHIMRVYCADCERAMADPKEKP